MNKLTIVYSIVCSSSTILACSTVRFNQIWSSYFKTRKFHMVFVWRFFPSEKMDNILHWFKKNTIKSIGFKMCCFYYEQHAFMSGINVKKMIIVNICFKIATPRVEITQNRDSINCSDMLFEEPMMNNFWICSLIQILTNVIRHEKFYYVYHSHMSRFRQ